MKKLGKALSYFATNTAAAILVIQLATLPGLNTSFGVAQAGAVPFSYNFDKAGEAACEAGTRNKDPESLDPCPLATLHRKGGNVEDSMYIMYLITAGACAAACWNPSGWMGWCAGLNWAAFGVEFAAAIAVQTAGASFGSQMKEKFFNKGKIISGYGGVSTSLGAALVATVENTGSSLSWEWIKATDHAEELACASIVVMDLFLAYVRNHNAQSDYKDANGYYKQKAEMVGTTHINLAGGPQRASTTSMSSQQQSTINSMPDFGAMGPVGDSNLQKRTDGFVQSAASIGATDILDKMEKQGGLPLSKMIPDMLSGNRDPMDVMKEGFGDKLGSAGQEILATSDSLAKEIKDNHPDMAKTLLAMKGGNVTFASTGSGSGSRGPASGSLDFSKMLGLGGGDTPAAKGGSKTVHFNSKGLPVVDGLHAPTTSLFDVVDSRYEDVYARFANGENILGANRSAVREPAASDVPANVYLGK